MTFRKYFNYSISEGEAGSVTVVLNRASTSTVTAEILTQPGSANGK